MNNKKTDTKRIIYRGAKDLSFALDIVTKPMFKKRGFAENKILTDWNMIVGQKIGNNSVPRKLIFSRNKKVDGVLHIEVYDSGMAMEISYMEPIFIEKIASYFGYKAVSKLKIIQRPGGAPKIKEKKPVKIKNEEDIPDEKKNKFNELLAEIDDDEMRAAFKSLGTSILAE